MTSTKVVRTMTATILEPHPCDPPHHDLAADEASGGVQEQLRAARILEHRLEVVGAEREEREPEQDRETREHVARQPPLCGQHLQLATELEPLADRVADVVEHL